MMRVLRSSLYLHPARPPLTTVVRDSDTVDTLESVRMQLAEETRENLVVFDIFDMPDANIVLATNEAMRRQAENAEQEGHMATLYWWTVTTWERVASGGMILMDKPAPLARNEIEAVFDQLANREDYNEFIIISHTSDGEPVTLKDGEIT